MSQEDGDGDPNEAVGYALREAAAALRAAMDVVLRPLELTAPQYACLELVGRRPGLSNAELARSVVASRQSLNRILCGLQDRGLVTRPTTAAHGRSLPTELTTTGRRRLETARAAVRRVEQQMVATMSLPHQHRLRGDLPHASLPYCHHLSQELPTGSERAPLRTHTDCAASRRVVQLLPQLIDFLLRVAGDVDRDRLVERELRTAIEADEPPGCRRC